MKNKHLPWTKRIYHLCSLIFKLFVSFLAGNWQGRGGKVFVQAPVYVHQNRKFSDKCFVKEIRFFSSSSRSSTRKWPCTENWSFLLGMSRSAAPHSGRKCTRQEPKAVKWPVRHTKNLLPSQGRRLLALFGHLYTGCMYADSYLWWPRPQR